MATWLEKLLVGQVSLLIMDIKLDAKSANTLTRVAALLRTQVSDQPKPTPVEIVTALLKLFSGMDAKSCSFISVASLFYICRCASVKGRELITSETWLSLYVGACHISSKFYELPNINVAALDSNIDPVTS